LCFKLSGIQAGSVSLVFFSLLFTHLHFYFFIGIGISGFLMKPEIPAKRAKYGAGAAKCSRRNLICGDADRLQCAISGHSSMKSQ